MAKLDGKIVLISGGTTGTLVIARDYIVRGIHARTADPITRELAPETEIEVVRKPQQEVTAERFTHLDRAILRDAPQWSSRTQCAAGKGPAWRAARTGRLRTLERMALAEEAGPGHWRLSAELETRLRRMGERGDIIKTMHRELAMPQYRGARQLPSSIRNRPASAWWDASSVKGFSDELRERRCCARWRRRVDALR
ncbi:DUF3363 domain-containing protein [Bradyrhizobium tropiciagri]|uniref:DUF3363 domain-containing protein n=1 Tax=Bradyrhizobium tropiciagri TaxID=312253 RepID=UPI00067A7556|nr:DUF3363 domain-containing protein [Bradyrhizobium tropiciagri]